MITFVKTGLSEAQRVQGRRADVSFFGRQEPDCMLHDETLLGVSEKVKNFAIICELSLWGVGDESVTHHDFELTRATPPSFISQDTCDTTQVPDFTKVSRHWFP